MNRLITIIKIFVLIIGSSFESGAQFNIDNIFRSNEKIFQSLDSTRFYAGLKNKTFSNEYEVIIKIKYNKYKAKQILRRKPDSIFLSRTLSIIFIVGIIIYWLHKLLGWK